MRKEANDFLKICDILDRDYKKTDGNKFRYAKTYLEQNVGPDYDQLKSLHAEATDEKASDASIVSCLCVLEFLILGCTIYILAPCRNFFGSGRINLKCYNFCCILEKGMLSL